jgi:hypothetical protein
MDFTRIMCENVDRINLTPNRDERRARTNRQRNVRVT